MDTSNGGYVLQGSKAVSPHTLAIQHFNNGGSVVVRTRGHNVLYAKRWSSMGHTEAVLTSAIQESDSFNCVGEILC